MASVQKITLSASRDIPFNKLVLSQSNVRRVKAGVSIEELADDIARRTLLQSLSVRPILDAEGQETGMFEVPAGGRRYRALEHLVKQKRMNKTQPVPCVVRTSGLAEEDSLAENVHREALHPLDQFRAFQTLREKGLSEEDIAARFFVSPTVVKQRLKLAAVSPKLLDIYAEVAEDAMAMPVIKGAKTRAEKFAGALKSYSIEAMMQNGLALQAGTSHDLGQNFGKAFGARFQSKEGKLDYVWQTSWGVSTRLIGGLIMTVAATFMGEWHTLRFSPRSAFAFSYLVIFGSIVAYGCYTYAVQTLPLSLVSTYAYINPLIAVILGWAILREPLSWRVLISAAIILAGVAMVKTAPKRHAKRQTFDTDEAPSIATVRTAA